VLVGIALEENLAGLGVHQERRLGAQTFVGKLRPRHADWTERTVKNKEKEPASMYC
jgi:hypothetical protein